MIDESGRIGASSPSVGPQGGPAKPIPETQQKTHSLFGTIFGWTKVFAPLIHAVKAHLLKIPLSSPAQEVPKERKELEFVEMPFWPENPPPLPEDFRLPPGVDRSAFEKQYNEYYRVGFELGIPNDRLQIYAACRTNDYFEFEVGHSVSSPESEAHGKVQAEGPFPLSLRASQLRAESRARIYCAEPQMDQAASTRSAFQAYTYALAFDSICSNWIAMRKGLSEHQELTEDELKEAQRIAWDDAQRVHAFAEIFDNNYVDASLFCSKLQEGRDAYFPSTDDETLIAEETEMFSENYAQGWISATREEFSLSPDQCKEYATLYAQTLNDTDSLEEALGSVGKLVKGWQESGELEPPPNP